MRLDLLIPPEIRKLIQFGLGVGIEIGAVDLEVVVARVRPTGARVIGRRVIKDFAGRTAGEWGSEYASFLKSLGIGRVSATALLPRRDVVVRQVSLPGVPSSEMDAAIRLQLDALHPFGDDEVAWGWSPLGSKAALVGVARRSTVDAYIKLFTEAGVMVSSFTFSAAAIRAAIRLNGAGTPAGFVALCEAASGGTEVYGESQARPLFSAAFDGPPQRAAAVALSELRLPPETEPVTLTAVLPKPTGKPVDNDLSRNALPYATALAGACPRLAPAANVLPPEHRRFSSRAMFVPTVVLAVLLLGLMVGAVTWSRMEQRDYVRTMRAEITGLAKLQERAVALDRDTDRARARTAWLDRYRAQTRKDLDALNELTKIIESPAWTSNLEMTHEAIRIQGEAPQASALWKIIDASGLFRGANLEHSQPSPAGGENFIIRAEREPGK